jgi:hypothetical protein
MLMETKVLINPQIDRGTVLERLLASVAAVAAPPWR